MVLVFFFFQAEDGIRDIGVTGVQTCALPIFFRAASKLKREPGRALKFALIGYPMGWGRGQVESLLRRYGLEGDCEVYERVPHGEVARVVADSKVSLLL